VVREKHGEEQVGACSSRFFALAEAVLWRVFGGATTLAAMPHLSVLARGLALLPPLLAAACATSPVPDPASRAPSEPRGDVAVQAATASWSASPTFAPQDAGIRTPSRSPSGPGLQLREWSVEAFWVPFIAIEVDSDNVSDPAAEPDASQGSGYGVRVGIGDEDQGIGVLYIGSMHDEDVTRTDLRTDSFYADFHARGLLWQQGSTRAWARFNGGAGLAVVDFEGPYDDQTTGALQLRGAVQLEFSDRFSIDLGLGGFVWGVPGDTVAFGSLMTVGGSLRF
jgi:hypothetical protein